jgi:alpha-N-acetylglucosamine transferase
VTAIVTCLALLLWFVTFGFQGPTNTPNSDDSKPTRYAFATVLTTGTETDRESRNVEEPYLQAARLLTFQLLRNPRTRSRVDNVPFLILVTPNVPKKHRDILSREGATVVPVEPVNGASSEWERSNDVLATLDLWKFEEYDKILFLSVDSVIFRPIHEIFDDPATSMRATINPTGKIPKNYMIAASHESRMNLNTQPLSSQQSYQKGHAINGFFILHPSKELYNYYVSLLHTPDEHDSGRPGKKFLNYAHRANGPMPWQSLEPRWNLNDASQSDYERALKSIHHKLWDPTTDEFVGDRSSMSMDEMKAYLNH